MRAFLPCDAMHSAAIAVTRCLSVCPLRSGVAPKRIKISSKFVHHRVATPFYFSYTKGGADIPTGTPLTGGMKNPAFRPLFSPISRSISETVIDRWARAARQFVSIEFSFQHRILFPSIQHLA